MVGHTGDLEATRVAVETVDQCVGKIVAAVLEKSGTVTITADHGNAEKMKDDHGGPYTAHTTYPVPFTWWEIATKGLTSCCALKRSLASWPGIAAGKFFITCDK